MRILLYEHVSGGGYAGQPLPSSLLSEGFGMLRGLTEDFKAAGHEISILLDSRIATMNPPILADHVVEINSPTMRNVTLSLAAESTDAAYAIAPEAEDTLQSIVERIEDAGAISLNSKTLAIHQASDKTALTARTKRLGLKSPETIRFTVNEPAAEIAQEIKKNMGFPAIMKPSTGAGCTGLSIVQSEKQVGAAVRKIALEAADEQIIAQELIRGVSSSVSLISTGAKAMPVSLNLQDVTLEAPEAESTYNGGQVPLDHPAKAGAFKAAKCLVDSFKGLRGYVGVDLLIADNDAYIVEVNPRLTTSFVGLRKAVTFNVAQAIADSVLKEELPKETEARGYVCFSKVETSPCSESNWPKICSLKFVASPPFPLANTKKPCALLQTSGKTPGEANRQLAEAKKHLNEICLGEQKAW